MIDGVVLGTAFPYENLETSFTDATRPITVKVRVELGAFLLKQLNEP